MQPGFMALTRMLCGPRSRAMSRVKPSIPAFAAAYAATCAVVAKACTDAVFTMHLPHDRIMSG
jgi:hypothetical protein